MNNSASTHPIRRLPEAFTKHRRQYEQICRSNAVAIYLVHLNGRQRSYEVIVIRVADRVANKGTDGIVRFVSCAPYECYPSTELWGTVGFTLTTEADARAKFALLNDPRFKQPAPPIYPIRSRAPHGIAVGRTSDLEGGQHTAGDE